MLFFQPFYPSDVIRGQSSVQCTRYFVCVRVRVRVRVRVWARVSSIHGEKHNNVGHPFIALLDNAVRGRASVAR